MSRNGSGTYTLPAGNPVVTGTTITTTWANTTLSDIASSLTGSVAADGQTPMTGSLNMANNKVTALATPTVATDAVTKGYTDGLISGLGTMSTQNANSVAITGGTINGATIGATTRADGKFTTLAANGDVDFTSTGYLAIPSGTTAQRPAIPVNGEMRYNTTINQFEGYASSAWTNLAGGVSSLIAGNGIAVSSATGNVTVSSAAGTVIQVVQASNSTSASTTGTTYVASNLAASITPKSSTSKIFVLINAPLAITQLSAAAYAMGLQLNRGATAVFTDNAVGDSFYNGEYGNYIGTWKQRTPLIYLDSPATTSSTTYTLYFAAYQGTAFVSNSSAIGTITLMEIAA